MRLVARLSDENCACSERTELITSTLCARLQQRQVLHSAQVGAREEASCTLWRARRFVMVRGLWVRTTASMITANRLQLCAQERRARDRLVVLRPAWSEPPLPLLVQKGFRQLHRWDPAKGQVMTPSMLAVVTRCEFIMLSISRSQHCSFQGAA